MIDLQSPYDQAMHPVQQQPPAGAKSRAAWIIAGAVVLAAAIIAIAVIAVSGRRSEPTSAAPPAPTATASAESSATCAAWRATRPALDAIPRLPEGWNWDTPNIDTAISSLKASNEAALALFEPRIRTEDGEPSTAAREFISARRAEMQMLTDHSYTYATGGVRGNVAVARLNEICGVKG